MNPRNAKAKQTKRAASAVRPVLFGLMAIACLPFAAVSLAQPDEDKCDPDDARCEARDDAGAARESLNLGDAAAAVGNIVEADRNWREAIKYGVKTGAQASIIAQKRLQMYTLTTWSTAESLAALDQQLNGPIVNVPVLQHALAALGYYDGPRDGQLSIETRAALHKFQNDMAFNETDSLVPRQIVYLIANGAETARDARSQTTLAFMFVAGVGVPQNTDFAAAWLRKASARYHSEATFYLSILHGTGHCRFPKSSTYGDQYLREAGRQNHQAALYLLKRYAKPPGQSFPWPHMKNDPVVQKALAIFGDNCVPPPMPAPKP